MATTDKETYEKLQAKSEDKNTLSYYTSPNNPVYTGEFRGVLIGNATTAKQLEHDYTLSVTGDATGQVRLNAGDAQLVLKVLTALHAGSADFAGKTEFSSHSSHADMANSAEYAYESGHTPQADHADRATLADKAEQLTWDMIQVVSEYPSNTAQDVLYIKVHSEFNDGNYEIVGFRYRGKDGLINTTDLTLYRIRYTNRALTEDFLEHRKIWAIPSPKRTLVKEGEIQEVNVSENDNIPEVEEGISKLFTQDDLL